MTNAPTTRAWPLRVSLWLALGGFVLVLWSVSTALSHRATREMQDEVTVPVLDLAAIRTRERVASLVGPIEQRLAVDHEWVRRGVLKRHDNAGLLRSLVPPLQQLPHVGSMMVGDESGYQFLIMRYDERVRGAPLLAAAALPAPVPDRLQYLSRDVRLAEWGDQARFQLFSPDGQVRHSWTQGLEGYDPRTRPWLRLALQGYADRSAEELVSQRAGAISWTEVYELFTTKTPGISASIATEDQDGVRTVIAYDLLLDDLSRFSEGYRPTPHGFLVISDEQGRVLGLPSDPRFSEPSVRAAALLKPISQIGVEPVVVAARLHAESPGGAHKFEAQGQAWWATVRGLELGGRERIFVTIIVPESDVLASAKKAHATNLWIALAGLGFALLMATALARRFERPIAHLLERTQRLGELDLDAAPPLQTRIGELRELDRRLERGRAALASHLDSLREAREQLAHSEGLFRGLFDGAADCIIVTDPDGLVVEANDRALRVLGVTRAAPHKSLADSLGREAWEQVRSGEVVSIDLVSALQRPFPAEIAARQIRVDERTLIVAILRDVSDRRSLEQQLARAQKMEALGRLAGGVAHDFNNILTAIVGLSELAGKSESDRRSTYLDDIKTTAMRAADLTKQLLAFSKRQVVRAERLDVRRMLSELQTMLSRVIGDDVAMQVEVAPDLGPVKMDAGHFQQLVLNMAVNARDAMPSGGIFRIEAKPSGDYVLLTFSDEGVGIEPDVLSRIFEPFFSTKSAGRGSGLGLSICYGIVEQAGGTIACHSEVGRGTSFMVQLPVTQAQHTVAVDDETARGSSPQKGLVLIVEDQPALRSIFRRVLKDSGLTTEVVASGGDAISFLSKARGDVLMLVTDVVLPGTSGRDVAELFRARYPQRPVLYVSGYAPDGGVQDDVDLGLATFLAKPFTAGQLLEAVRRALSKSAAAHDLVSVPGGALSRSENAVEDGHATESSKRT